MHKLWRQWNPYTLSPNVSHQYICLKNYFGGGLPGRKSGNGRSVYSFRLKEC